jgi:hypothetical protein
MITLSRWRKTPEARLVALSTALLAHIIVFLPGANSLWAQQSVNGERKVLTRVTPQDPSVAHGLRIQGVVRVDAIVAPSGIAKTVEIKGGHPLLGQTACNAIRLWKWEPASHESHELIEIKFNSE